MANEFTWGDPVRILEDVGRRLKAGVGAVVAITPVVTQHLAKSYSTHVGDVVYTVERSDGSDVAVPSALLERLPDDALGTR